MHPGLHPANHNNLGVMLARLGDLKDAQREFESRCAKAAASLMMLLTI